MGERLLKSVPNLTITWTTSTIEFSPLGLFGRLSVPIEELYGIAVGDFVADPNDWLAGARKLRNAKKAKGDKDGAGKGPDEMKQRVSKYLIQQLYLGAEMCLDRNYVAMDKNSLFSYDLLVTILTLDVDESLKSAVANLIVYLHVDRDPQVIIHCLSYLDTICIRNIILNVTLIFIYKS